MQAHNLSLQPTGKSGSKLMIDKILINALSTKSENSRWGMKVIPAKRIFARSRFERSRNLLHGLLYNLINLQCKELRKRRFSKR
jgi:hypothetical protein